MGQQTSSNALNCKNTAQDKKSQIIASKQFAIQINKRPKQQDNQDHRQQKGVMRVSSAKFLSPRNASQVSIPSSTTTLTQKYKTNKKEKNKFKIPEHQSVIKVSLSPFPNSLHSTLTQNPCPYFIEPKLKTLGQIVESRYRTTKHLPYSQILTLLQSLLYGCAYFCKKSIPFHDYYPTNIFYINGKFKIQNPVLSKSSGFLLTVQRKRFSFLSPQLIIALLEDIQQEQLGQQNLYKSDIFSIGMILLQTCSLEPSSECYDQENYNIIDSVIRQRIAKIAKVYTPQFAECVNLMLQYQVQHRLDPILISQLVHSKIQQQKKIAFQMENQHIKHQNFQPQNGPVVMPLQNMMSPPQKPILYNHQPFKMQNINPNSIVVPLPNEMYSRIGPNNQGFLSASTLQNKLRVIELIHENPNQQEQEEQEDRDKKIINKKQIQNANLIQSKNTNNLLQLSSSAFDNKYPFVESIYSKETLDKRQIQNQRQRQRQRQIQTQNRKYHLNSNVDQKFVDVKIKPQIKINSNLQNNMQRVPFYPISPKNQFSSMQMPSNFTNHISVNNKYQQYANKNISIEKIEIKQPEITQKQGFVTSAPASTNIYKYGTSYELPNRNIQGQTLQARVQRVLKISRNVK